jgi:hypothetical protein
MVDNDDGSVAHRNDDGIASINDADTRAERSSRPMASSSLHSAPSHCNTASRRQETRVHCSDATRVSAVAASSAPGLSSGATSCSHERRHSKSADCSARDSDVDTTDDDGTAMVATAPEAALEAAAATTDELSTTHSGASELRDSSKTATLKLRAHCRVAATRRQHCHGDSTAFRAPSHSSTSSCSGCNTRSECSVGMPQHHDETRGVHAHW